MRLQTVFVTVFLLLFYFSGVSGFNVSFRGGSNDEFQVSFPTHPDDENNVSEDLCLPSQCKASPSSNVLLLTAYALVFLVFLLLAVDFAITQLCPHSHRSRDSRTSDSGTAKIQKISVNSEMAEGKPVTKKRSDLPV